MAEADDNDLIFTCHARVGDDFLEQALRRDGLGAGVPFPWPPLECPANPLQTRALLESAWLSCMLRTAEALGARGHKLRGRSGRNTPMDTLTVAQRSERMSRIRGKNTKPEMLVRRALHRLGYRYSLHRRDLPGAPDLVFPSRKKVLFVHGCFWHAHDKCSVANLPKSRRSYWVNKFAKNKERDAQNIKQLRKEGWRVSVVWECETKKLGLLVRRLAKQLGAPGPHMKQGKAADGR